MSAWRRQLAIEESQLRTEYKNTLMFLNRVPEPTAQHFAETVSLEQVRTHVEYGRTHLPVIDTHYEIQRAIDDGLDIYEVFS